MTTPEWRTTGNSSVTSASTIISSREGESKLRGEAERERGACREAATPEGRDDEPDFARGTAGGTVEGAFGAGGGVAKTGATRRGRTSRMKKTEKRRNWGEEEAETSNRCC